MLKQILRTLVLGVTSSLALAFAVGMLRSQWTSDIIEIRTRERRTIGVALWHSWMLFQTHRGPMTVAEYVEMGHHSPEPIPSFPRPMFRWYTVEWDDDASGDPPPIIAPWEMSLMPTIKWEQRYYYPGLKVMITTYKELVPGQDIVVAVRMWPFFVLTSLYPAMRLGYTVRRYIRRRGGRCVKCGYDLRATPDRCPECGTAVPPKADETPKPNDL